MKTERDVMWKHHRKLKLMIAYLPWLRITNRAWLRHVWILGLRKKKLVFRIPFTHCHTKERGHSTGAWELICKSPGFMPCLRHFPSLPSSHTFSKVVCILKLMSGVRICEDIRVLPWCSVVFCAWFLDFF